ncbi:hypothetical protein N7540_011202 [Penicillium herquei]|nr:hypothetical protein N7540_013233 [Penicillium herquei]KAJ6004718.1 hypothetical protein N7540_013087 [Penicillium herquei]KAJ6016611.1 hypothetical protein N7540_011202 [Penicillium herquei]
MAPAGQASNEGNSLEIRNLRKKLSQSFAGRTTPPPSKESTPAKATRVQAIEFRDTKTEFVMEVDENGARIVRRYHAFSVMELDGAEEAIQKFHSHILPKGGLQPKNWRIEPGHEVTLRLAAGMKAPIFMERGLDGNFFISIAPGTSWAQEDDLKTGSKMKDNEDTMTPTWKASDESPSGMRTLRKKLSEHFASMTRLLPSTITKTKTKEAMPKEVSSEVKATKVRDTKPEFVMEVDENDERTVHPYHTFGVMELDGAEEAIQKFHSHILPKGVLQRKVWQIQPGNEVTLRLTAGSKAPIFMERGIDGNFFIPGASWTQDTDLRTGGNMEDIGDNSDLNLKSGVSI